MTAPTWQERLISGLDKSGPGGCWLWTKCRDVNGYGSIRIGGRRGFQGRTHRLVYELLVGPIPEGLQLDHLCRVRHCANPAHLEPVTPKENSRRGMKAQAKRCQRGHPFDERNTEIRADGRRSCIKCRNRSRRALDREFLCGRCEFPLRWGSRGGWAHSVGPKRKHLACGAPPLVVAGQFYEDMEPPR